MIDTSASEITSKLRGLGFFRLEENLPGLKAKVEKMADRAGREAENAFAAYPSFIPADFSEAMYKTVISIDVGGTSTKVGLRKLRDGEVCWQILFEKFNDEFQGSLEETKSLAAFTEVLAENIVSELRNISATPKEIEAIGIVWSTPHENIRLNEIKGISGLVAQRELFTKDEWFNKDVKNGDDVGEAFLESFSQHGFDISCFIISNDTPLTLKALSDADAGMVASTGVNGTLSKKLNELKLADGCSEERIVCNAEMGLNWKLESGEAGKGDLISEGKPAEIVEHLMGGRYLPRSFCFNIISLAEEGVEAFRPLAGFLNSVETKKEEYFSAADLCFLIQDLEAFKSRVKDPEYFTEEVTGLLKELAAAIVSRAAKLAAVMAYGTVCNQLKEKNVFKIALDSRLAREIDLFRTVMKETLLTLEPEGVRLKLELVQPLELESGSVSVPMQGAANTLDCFL